LVFSGTPEELFEGDQPVERWGLRRPVVSELASRLGVSAASCEEFCEEVRKGGAAL
jgi:cobalt/nickel transport system ATP-binding protein/energy-coupling factor transport system ATP-binding protein